MPLVVKGYRELVRADSKATAETKLGVRKSLRVVAEPVKRDAQTFARARIRNMVHSPDWANMRTGITTRVVYVAPKLRGARKRSQARARRPNLAPLLMDRAMQRALDANVHQVEHEFLRMLDTIGAHWGAGGP